MNIQLKKEIPFKGNYDIIVAGGGVAGVAAAVNGAKMGKKVLLIEKTITLGGLATIGLVNYFVPMCNGRGTQIIKGMAEEMFQLAIQYGYDSVPKDWANGEPGEGTTQQRDVTMFSVPIYIMALTEFVKSSGAELMFDTVVSDVVMEGNKCMGVVIHNKSGFGYYTAKMFVDTTGDADLLHLAGVPTVQGSDFHTFFAFQTNIEHCKQVVEHEDMRYLQMNVHGGKASLYGDRHPEGKPKWHGTDAEEVTRYVIENHHELLENIKGDDRRKREVYNIPTMPQFRTTRRLDGDYTLLEEDKYKHFEDSVGAICDFDRRDYLYEIPLRTLCKKEFPNIITAGRSASGDGYGWDILRVIPPAIIEGQAAAVVCSMAIDSSCGVAEVDIKKLQSVLESQNVIIHFDDALINDNGGEKFESDHI